MSDLVEQLVSEVEAAFRATWAYMEIDESEVDAFRRAAEVAVHAVLNARTK